MTKRYTVSLLAWLIAQPCWAATALPIDRTAAVAALKDAAGRNGDNFSLSLIRCGENGDNCRYDAGEGVELSVTTLGGPKVYQLDVGWSNSRAGSTPQSASRFKALCRAVVATVRPAWNKAQVAKQAGKLAVLHPIKGDHLDVEERQPDVIFYGSRNIPDHPDFPTEAFVQCGVTANVE